jgi:hypothetical protein
MTTGPFPKEVNFIQKHSGLPFHSHFIKAIRNVISYKCFPDGFRDSSIASVLLALIQLDAVAMWKPIGQDQYVGDNEIIVPAHPVPITAYWSGWYWCTCDAYEARLIPQPTHYLANIPPVPEE